MKTSVSWDRAELVIDAKMTTITKRNLFMVVFIPNVSGAHNKAAGTVRKSATMPIGGSERVIRKLSPFLIVCQDGKSKLSIRMVAGFAEVAERKEILVAGACNHPNCLALAFRLELIRLAA